MNNFINLKNKLFNQPLLLEPSYAEILIGAVADRFQVNSLFNGEEKLSFDQLKEGAFGFNTDRSERKPYAVKSGTAIIPVSGSLVAKTNTLRPYSGMTGYDGIKVNLDMALNDDDVDNILFDMDSGGGEVTGCFELADYIFESRGNKKLTAMVGSLSCSACYAIASACDEVVLSETATVGSIGVITAHTSVEKAMEDRGVEVTLIHAGKHKADGNPYKKLPKEVKDRIQANLDNIHMMFAERVAKYRGMSVDAILATEALTYLGASAVDVGLADNVVSCIDFVEKLSHTSGTTITLENNMSDKDHEQALADANAAGVKAGTAAGIKQGGIEMQERIKGIFASENAEGRTKMAHHLAFSTSMTVEEADTMLSMSGIEAPVAVAPVAAPVATTETPAAALNAAMGNQEKLEVGAEHESEEITAESDPVAFTMQSMKQVG